MPKPILALDWHDTLVEYTDPFCEWLFNTEGLKIERAAITDDLRELGVSQKQFNEFELSNPQFKPLPGAVQAVQALSHKYELRVVTASEHVERTFYLYRKVFPQIQYCHFARAKEYMIQYIGACGMVDDIVRNLQNLPTACLPVCFAQPWNTNYKGVRGNWEELTDLLLEAREYHLIG